MKVKASCISAIVQTVEQRSSTGCQVRGEKTMIVKYGDKYLNTDHIVSANAENDSVCVSNGNCYYLPSEVFKKLLEVWLDEEMQWGVLYKEITEEHWFAFEYEDYAFNGELFYADDDPDSDNIALNVYTTVDDSDSKTGLGMGTDIDVYAECVCHLD